MGPDHRDCCVALRKLQNQEKLSCYRCSSRLGDTPAERRAVEATAAAVMEEAGMEAEMGEVDSEEAVSAEEKGEVEMVEAVPAEEMVVAAMVEAVSAEERAEAELVGEALVEATAEVVKVVVV